MSPIDDELRSALHGRAGDLPVTSYDLSPDFFAGVELRAKRMRRNKVAASVAGSALVVAAIAVAMPMLSSSTTSMQPAPQATAPASETPQPESSPFALDPADPWEYRGDPQVLDDGNLDTITREWAVRHDADPGELDITPLFGQVYEPSGQAEVVFVATDDQGDSWWGVVQTTESGPEFLHDVPLLPGTTALAAALPGDEVARLLVVAAPQVGQIEYAPDDAGEWSPMFVLAPGVATTPLEGDPASDRIRVLDGDGDTVYDAPAPDPSTR